MTDRPRFQVVPPDWGEAHLTLEAVVAYVDDELASGPHERATRHLERCADCAAEVAGQRRARSVLRGADAPTLPPSLMSTLRSIPQETELPPPPAGLSLTPEGELVSVLRPASPDGQQRRSRRSRRVKLGTGAAVSGIALGALAFGVPAAWTSAPAPAPGGQGPAAAAVARFATTPAQAPRQRSTSVAPVSEATGGAQAPEPAAPLRNVGLPPSG
ncbi:zf-HC2 domain-containing protein [Pseudonocardia sp. NPDC049635]|uniref:anti-sigma factor family protein n=1 Tax=Pseudonocardia sp. NPDC049635 TaxID=3155506 RepID=UPI0033EFE176